MRYLGHDVSSYSLCSRPNTSSTILLNVTFGNGHVSDIDVIIDVRMMTNPCS